MPIFVILRIPVAASILSLAWLGIAWMGRTWSFLGRLENSIVALASVLIALFGGYWNMLIWRL